jgi:hypothetical protein
MRLSAASAGTAIAEHRRARLDGVRLLAQTQESPSAEWLTGVTAWDALVQIVAHNHPWMAKNTSIAIWLQHVQAE